MHIQPYTQKAMALACTNHWWFRILGVERPIVEPVYKDGWWFVPKEQDKSIIPANALRRVEELYKSGVPVTRVIVAHEAPQTLCPPSVQPIQTPTREIGKGLVTIGAIASVLAATFTVLLPLALLVPMALIDPALIVQLPDGTLVEVMRWVE